MGTSLLCYIHNATEDKYMENLVNEDAGLREDNISTVLKYLFKNYGKAQSEEVKQKEVEVLSITFNPAEPMVLIYRSIEKLQKLAITASIPYTEAQILKFVLTLIRSTKDKNHWVIIIPRPPATKIVKIQDDNI